MIYQVYLNSIGQGVVAKFKKEWLIEENRKDEQAINF